MKLFFVLVVVLGASANIHVEFHKFKAQFGKTYLNQMEEAYRKKIFADNVKLINDHNAKYDKGEESFFMGINQFTDLMTHELPTGLIVANITDVEYHEYDPTEVLASEVDWRKKGAVTPVKDQQHCGSCWAFSATGTLEGAWAAKHGKLISLSEQNLVDCAHNHCHGCHGGIPAHALQHIKRHGIDSEKQYPYNAKDGKCHFSKPDNPVKVKHVKELRYGDERGLHSAVHARPVSICLAAGNNAFQHYAGGILDSHDCPTELDHAVLAVGYGKDRKSGKDFWIVKNSWGKRWGEHGYIRIVRGKNMCGLASMSSYPVV